MAITTVDINATTVGTPSVTVAVANPKRVKLVIKNTSANPVRVGFTNPQTATTGTRLAQNESFVLEGEKVPTDAVYGIREGGSDGTVSGYEMTKS